MWRAITQIVLPFLSPIFLAITALLFAITDLAYFVFGKRVQTDHTPASHHSASIVIPNWNGRDLLARFLPYVIRATAAHPSNEVIVVDNASTDGSVDFLRDTYPQVKVLALDRNLGFGGGSNTGIKAAQNDIVVLLNNDMRVELDFLEPLLEPFADPLVFAVSSQIFLSDPERRREETGLTRTWWERGRLRVTHVADPEIRSPFPCAYPGGGSSAFDRRKFLELGGFDHLLRPFYYEDTDLGYGAWKRGWKVLYQPASVVYHEHRGTIGRRFSNAFINDVLDKNAILICWKNIHDWSLLLSQFRSCFTSSLAALLSGETEGRYTFSGLTRAFSQLIDAAKSRWRARSLAVISDKEAFHRQIGGYYRDRFQVAQSPLPDRLNVLFASPYAIEPPVHGGAVFMKETLERLAESAHVHLLSFVDTESQLPAQESLRTFCRSAQFFVRHIIPRRNPATTVPHAVREFADPDFAWALHRTMYLQQVDVVQLDYTVLSQYGGNFFNLPCILFEHDIFFQSLWRRMRVTRFNYVGLLEYLRMLRYELLQVGRFTRVQVCSEANARYLVSFVPEMKSRIDSDLRAIIDTSRYAPVYSGRDPDTLLFIGSFRHSPNLQGVLWFVKHVFPAVLLKRPGTKLVIVGADAPRTLREHPQIEVVGFVDDVREPLARYAVFICPILSGSGLRVKLLEAFAAGIPVVSTRIGAEGLASQPDPICELADSPSAFSDAIVSLLENPQRSAELAKRARQRMERERDSREATRRLLESYRAEALRHRPHAPELVESARATSGYGITR